MGIDAEILIRGVSASTVTDEWLKQVSFDLATCFGASHFFLKDQLAIERTLTRYRSPGDPELGEGNDAEWLGSIAMDGYPDGNPEPILKETTEAGWRQAVRALLDGDKHATKPEQGWPWPWEDSHTTDYSYTFLNGKVMASAWGHAWFDPLCPPAEEEELESGKILFPNMKDRQAVTFGPRSGLLVIGGEI